MTDVCLIETFLLLAILSVTFVLLLLTLLPGPARVALTQEVVVKCSAMGGVREEMDFIGVKGQS